MGLWTELVGVRKDLHLRGKWWHYLANGIATFGAIVAYFIAAGGITNRAVKPTRLNTFSVTLLTQAVGRQQTTTLADLDALSGDVGAIAPNGDVIPLERPHGPGGLRCTPQARYRAGESVGINGVAYMAIPDSTGQADTELRHCIGIAAYSGLTAKTVVAYLPDGTGVRQQTLKGVAVGLSTALTFLLVYWNVYYRGLMPLYARRRRARRLLHQQRFQTGAGHNSAR
jgi:hypothetical protein